MAYLYSNTNNDEIYGTSEDDSIVSEGIRSTVLGAEGNDIIRVYGGLSNVQGGEDHDIIYAFTTSYGSTIQGGEGNDRVIALTSYVSLSGGEGNDFLYVDTNYSEENIANVTLAGGSDWDAFIFAPGDSTIFSAVIADFSAEDYDFIGLADFNSDDFEYYYDDEGNSIVSAINDDDIYLNYTRNTDSDLLFYNTSGKINFTMKNIKHFSDMADSYLTYYDTDDHLNYVAAVKFSWALRSRDTIQSGLTTYSNTAYVTSEYTDSIWLNGYDYFNNKTTWTDSSITNIDAVDDTISGRILAGNNDDNWIWANNYGSQLWGGFGGSDVLVGGDGDDVFWAGKNEDYTGIWNCSDDDLVNLWNINLDDVSNIDVDLYADTNNPYIDIVTNDGSNIRISPKEGATTTTFQLANGSKGQYNYSEQSWKWVD